MHPHWSRMARRFLPFAILTFWMVAPALAAVLRVNSLEDDTISGNGRVTLREAILAAENNTTTDLGQTGTGLDTLDLTRLAGTIELTGVMPTINGGVNLNGPGPEELVIDGLTMHSFLTLGAAADVSIEGLTIQNCFRADNGGAIRNAGGLAASNCVFRANRSRVINEFDAMGSAIYSENTGASIKLSDCVFADNVAELNSNGFIYFVGSAVGVFGSLSAGGCLFERNSTLLTGTPTGGGGMGHSLAAYTAGSSISISDCQIRDGFFVQPSDPNISSWGSVYALYTEFSASDSTWTGNVGYPVVGIYFPAFGPTTDTMTLTNCTFAQNGDVKSGSMILSGGNFGEITLEHCTFADNLNRGDYPNALYPPPGTGHNLRMFNTALASADKAANRPELPNGYPFTSNGFNFISNLGGAIPSEPEMTYANTAFTTVRVLLDPLGDYGGPTPTMALPDGSPLIDAADSGGFAARDQRGVTRPRDGDGVGGAQPDIGAYERFNGDLAVNKTVDRSAAGNGATLVYTLSVTNNHPSETASQVVVTDALPPNVRFVSFSGSTFTNVAHEGGEITARRTTLNPGAGASVQITCEIEPFTMVNFAEARQLGYETLAADNSSTAGTTLITPAAPRVTEFTMIDASPTSLSQIAFRLEFDRDVTGLDPGDILLGPESIDGTVAGIDVLTSSSVYRVNVEGLTESGDLQLVLIDNNSVRSDEGEPLGGFNGDSNTSSTVALTDRDPPQSGPVAAAGVLGPPASSLFHLLYEAGDSLSGVRGVEVFFRKGADGAFVQLPGGPFNAGFVAFDTAPHGGNGIYEFYTVAIDDAGNIEDKPAQPEIGVTFGDAPPQNGVIGWQLY